MVQQTWELVLARWNHATKQNMAMNMLGIFSCAHITRTHLEVHPALQTMAMWVCFTPEVACKLGSHKEGVRRLGPPSCLRRVISGSEGLCDRSERRTVRHRLGNPVQHTKHSPRATIRRVAVSVRQKRTRCGLLQTTVGQPCQSVRQENSTFSASVERLQRTRCSPRATKRRAAACRAATAGSSSSCPSSSCTSDDQTAVRQLHNRIAQTRDCMLCCHDGVKLLLARQLLRSGRQIVIRRQSHR